MKQKIALVEDDRIIAKLVSSALESSGFLVQAAYDGKEGVKMVLSFKPDLAILDWNLPEMNGLQICRYLRSNAPTARMPILILTVFGEMNQKVSAFEVGADDYLTKPFDVQELLARVKSLLRRGVNHAQTDGTVKSGIIEMDVQAHRVKISGKEVKLRPKEFEILAILLQSPGRVLSRQFLLERVWGYNSKLIMAHTVDTHMTRLREQIGPEASKLIQTIPGFGYKLEQRFVEERRKSK